MLVYQRVSVAFWIPFATKKWIHMDPHGWFVTHPQVWIDMKWHSQWQRRKIKIIDNTHKLYISWPSTTVSRKKSDQLCKQINNDKHTSSTSQSPSHLSIVPPFPPPPAAKTPPSPWSATPPCRSNCWAPATTPVAPPAAAIGGRRPWLPRCGEAATGPGTSGGHPVPANQRWSPRLLWLFQRHSDHPTRSHQNWCGCQHRCEDLKWELREHPTWALGLCHAETMFFLWNQLLNVAHKPFSSLLSSCVFVLLFPFHCHVQPTDSQQCLKPGLPGSDALSTASTSACSSGVRRSSGSSTFDTSMRWGPSCTLCLSTLTYSSYGQGK